MFPKNWFNHWIIKKKSLLIFANVLQYVYNLAPLAKDDLSPFRRRKDLIISNIVRQPQISALDIGNTIEIFDAYPSLEDSKWTQSVASRMSIWTYHGGYTLEILASSIHGLTVGTIVITLSWKIFSSSFPLNEWTLNLPNNHKSRVLWVAHEGRVCGETAQGPPNRHPDPELRKSEWYSNKWYTLKNRIFI